MHRLLLRGLLELRQNYWFWPTVLTVLAVLLGIALPAPDRTVGFDWLSGRGLLGAMQVEGARALLTTLAAAVLGVAGVAFSITIVAVSFASGNYGPRLIGNFMRDRTNQVVLGAFLATFAYCVTVLRAVQSASGEGGGATEAFVPQLAVLVAMALAFACLGALIYFIHHVPESINVMNLVARIGRELRETVAKASRRDGDRPEGREGEVAPRAAPRSADHPPPWDDEPDDAAAIVADETGYLEGFDFERLETLAEEKGRCIRVAVRPGTFVVEGDLVLSVWSRDEGASRGGGGSRGPLDDDERDELRTCFAVGRERTAFQDVLFLSDELVEVLARALSPGVNDPHTAMSCLDWLRGALVRFAASCPGEGDPHGGLVLREHVTFETMLERSFGRMRPYVGADRNAALHALDALEAVARASEAPERRARVVAQMDALADAARDLLGDDVSRGEVAARLLAAKRAVSGPPEAPPRPARPDRLVA